MIYITGGLAALFLLALLWLIFRIFIEARRERLAPGEITAGEVPPEVRERALMPLRLLSSYYKRRAPEQAGKCIDETMLSEELLILGTNPREIFYGGKGLNACCRATGGTGDSLTLLWSRPL